MARGNFFLTFALAFLGFYLMPCHAAEDGFVEIFNGQDLGNWDGNPDFWSVQDGAITGESTPTKALKGNTFIIWRGGEVGDFELKLEYKIVGGNSGIQYRSFEVPKEKWVIGGYQADIDSGDTFSGINYGERFRGILANRGQKTLLSKTNDGKFKLEVVGSVGKSAEIQAKIKKEDWNTYHVIAKDFTFEHRINDVVTSICTDNHSEQREKGVLALQLHAGPPMKVQFRKILLKKAGALKGAEAPAEKEKTSDKKKLLFIAGGSSHGLGAHDHKAGCHLLAKQLNESGLPIEATVHYPGWPQDAQKIQGFDAIIVYADGGGGHPIAKHVDQVMELTKKGMGLGFIHYGVEVEKGKVGDAFLEWTGGYFETNWSVNPHWTLAETKINSDHPIGRGVKPYAANDEWYYHMRFRPKMEGVDPILTAMPPPETLSRGNGSHSGNPEVRAAVLERKEPQHLMWARERADGGRGFGFTGGHFHRNWAVDDHRRLVLNACAWICKLDVPSSGVAEKNALTVDDMLQNHDENVQPAYRAELEKIFAQLKK